MTSVFLAPFWSFSRCSFGEEVFYLVYFFVAEAEVTCGHDSLGLAGVAGSDDGSGYSGMVESPGDCEFTDGAIVPVGNFAQAIDQRQIAGEIRFGEIGMQPAPIVFREPGRTLAGHGAGQEARGHWGINDYSNTLAQAVRQNLVFDLAVH